MPTVEQHKNADLAPEPVTVTAEEAWAIFDAEARDTLGISGEEFLRCWDAGEFADIADRDDHRQIMDLVGLIALVRPDNPDQLQEAGAPTAAVSTGSDSERVPAAPIQTRGDAARTVTPDAFYRRVTSRTDVRQILERLAR